MKKIKEKAFWIAFGDFGGRGLAFLTSIYLARVLGAEFYGLITVAIAILGYATWFADLGLMKIGIREIAKEPEYREFRSKEIFNLKVGLGAVVLIISTTIIYLIPVGPIQKQVILGYLYSLVPYALLMEWYYNGKQEFGKVALSKLLNGALYLGLVFWLVKGANDVTLVPIFYTSGVTFAVVVLATFALIDKPFTLAPRKFKTYKELLKRSSIIGIGGLFANVVQLLPPLLIGAFLSIRDAGIYGAAFKIIIIAMMFDRIFVNLLLPNLSSIWSSSKQNAIDRVDSVLRLLLVSGIIVTLITAFNADDIIGLLFGTEYNESTAILKILSVFIFLTFLNSLFSFGLLATGKDHEYFLATCLGGTVSAIIITLSVTFKDPEMVALSVVLSELVMCGFSFVWFRKVFDLKIMKSFLIILLSSSIIYFLSQYFMIHSLISSLATIFLISGISWYTNVIRVGDLFWAKEKILP